MRGIGLESSGGRILDGKKVCSVRYYGSTNSGWKLSNSVLKVSSIARNLGHKLKLAESPQNSFRSSSVG